MAITISAAFEQFRRNLEITNLQTETVSTRQTRVREVLQRELDVETDFLTGSYARSTMIAPLKTADIDICVVLNSRYFHHYNGQNGGPAGLLDLVRNKLRQTYTRTPDISRNGQAVTIRFDDFLVDVVPAFYRSGGGYLIPNSNTRSWKSTDPKKHVEIFSASNQQHNGNLVPLIKMVKAWNKSRGSFFASFHLEVLVRYVLSNVTITDFPSGLRYVFDKARTAVAMPLPDPAGYEYSVGNYLNSSLMTDTARNTLSNAYEMALRAEQWASGGMYVQTAIGEWRNLFPDYFPANG